MATPYISLKIVWFMALPAYADFDLRNIEDNWLPHVLVLVKTHFLKVKIPFSSLENARLPGISNLGKIGKNLIGAWERH